MDTCGIYNNDKEEFPKENDEGETMKEIKLLKIYHLQSYNERLIHFKIGQYNYLPSKEQLSRAGFIYLNIGDQVQCFYCNLKLKEWKRSDNAFEEHKNIHKI